MKSLRSKRRARRGARPRGLVLLGPQSPSPTLGSALAELETRQALASGAPVAVITAGWRDREGEPGLVDPELEGRTVELGLYERSERVADADRELADAHREAQNRLRVLRRAYNARLGRLIDAHKRLCDLRGDVEVLTAERADALESIRSLDRRHLERVGEIRGEFWRELDPGGREAVAGERAEIERAVKECEAVVIAGGHIATLLNRLRLFGLDELVGDRVVAAWSAGAMALAERVVLFHDRPPWGAGNSEAFDVGLGLAEGVVLFPHASDRLALDDRARAGRLAARFAPDACVLLDPGLWIDRVGSRWHGSGGVRRLDRAGRQMPFGVEAA